MKRLDSLKLGLVGLALVAAGCGSVVDSAAIGSESAPAATTVAQPDEPIADEVTEQASPSSSVVEEEEPVNIVVTTAIVVDDSAPALEVQPETDSSVQAAVVAEESVVVEEAAPEPAMEHAPEPEPVVEQVVAPAAGSEQVSLADAVAAVTQSDPVLQAQQIRLTELGFWLGEADGVFGERTSHAVTAFQKSQGLPRTGHLDDATVAQLAVAVAPTPRTTSGDVLEVDIARQILLVVDDGQLAWVFDIATGAAATPTPTGQYSIGREIDGYRYAPLGTLYRPKYFNGGIAFHGYTSVPTSPASHGCVRLTYQAMDFLWSTNLAPVGSTVVVY